MSPFSRLLKRDRRVIRLPRGVLVDLGTFLAMGEVTGHHHTVLVHPERYQPFSDLSNESLSKLGMSLAQYAEQLLKGSPPCTDSSKPACQFYISTVHRRGWLEVERHTILRHDEHGALILEPGNYWVINQQEFTPEGWTPVRD